MSQKRNSTPSEHACIGTDASGSKRARATSDADLYGITSTASTRKRARATGDTKNTPIIAVPTSRPRDFHVKLLGDSSLSLISCAVPTVSALTSVIIERFQHRGLPNTVKLHKAEVDAGGNVLRIDNTALPALAKITETFPEEQPCIEVRGLFNVSVCINLIQQAYTAFPGNVPGASVYKGSMTWYAKLNGVLVGRIRETFDIIAIYLRQFGRADKPTVAVLPQMSGLGKTALSLLFTQVLGRPKPDKQCYDERQTELREIMLGSAWSKYMFSLSDAEKKAICDPSNDQTVLVATLSTLFPGNNWQSFLLSKPLLVVAHPVVSPLQQIREQLLDQLICDEPTARNVIGLMDAHQVIKALLGVPGRTLVLVIDEYYRWTTAQYNEVKSTLAQWCKDGVCIILAGISTKPFIDKRNDFATLSLMPIHLSPLQPCHIAQMIKEACKLSGHGQPSVDTLTLFSEDLATATGGHSRSCSNVVKQALSRDDFLLESHLSFIENSYLTNTIPKHFERVAEGDYDLAAILHSTVLPAVVLAAVNDSVIDLSAKLPSPKQELCYTDVLIGFPLPLISDGPNRVKLSVGTHAMPLFISLMWELVVKAGVSVSDDAIKQPLISALVADIHRLYGSTDAGKLFAKLFTVSMVWSCFKARLQRISGGARVRVKDVLPFLTALHIPGDTEWPQLLEPHAGVTRKTLSDPATYTRSEEGYAQVFVALDRATSPNTAFLAPSFHLIVQCNCSSPLSWKNVNDELQKVSPEASATYAGGHKSGIFLVLSTSFCKGIVDTFQPHKADIIRVLPGDYKVSSRPNSPLNGVIHCELFSTPKRVTGEPEHCSVAVLSPPAKLGRCNPVDKLIVPEGMQVVLLNPASKHSFWKQLLTADVMSGLCDESMMSRTEPTASQTQIESGRTR